MRLKLSGIVLILVFVFITVGNAFAIPTLQLYIEGSTYDSKTQTWVTPSSSFKLWVLGTERIEDVRLSYAYNSSETTGTITFTPSTATPGTLPGAGDPSIASTPVQLSGIQGSGTGTAPIKGDGSRLPTHGIYGKPGVSWKTYSLGDFTLSDSPIGDYIGSTPTTWPDMGQINAYEVTITGYSWVHFDAFDHIVEGKNDIDYIKAPFSHDAGTGGSTTPPPVPEPATLSLFGLGFLGLLGLRRKK